MDRRVKFFTGGTAVAILISLVCPESLRVVPIAVAIVYAVIAVLVGLDRHYLDNQHH